MTTSVRFARSMIVAPFVLLLGAQGCVSKAQNPPAPPPPAAGSTGAFGIVTVDGKQKLYLPTPETSANGALAVVDVGVAGNGVAGAPALITTIDLGVPEIATATGGDGDTVIAVSTESKKIWFVDPKTDKLTKTIELDASYGRSGFSGGGGYVTGVAIDSAHHRAILSTWNGFAIVDLASQSITKVIEAPPSENFGFDSVSQRILAPFYDCAQSNNDQGALALCDSYKTPSGQPAQDGLNLIDLNDGTVYTYVDPKAESPEAPVGGEPDSAAIDPTTGIAIVPSEEGNYQNVIDLSKAQLDKNAKTFTAPHQYIKDQGLTGVAIEPNAHWAFWEEEHSADVGLANVQDANNGAAAFVHASMPDVPGGDSWSNMGDPHGIAVTTGIADGHPVGFVVDANRRWVARVDLQKMADAGKASPTAPDITPAVTYLDAQTPIAPAR